MGRRICVTGRRSARRIAVAVVLSLALVVTAPSGAAQSSSESHAPEPRQTSPAAPDTGPLQSATFPSWYQVDALLPGQIATGIGFDPSGQFWVANLGAWTIDPYTLDGTLAGPTLSVPGPPRGVDFHSNGRMYVATIAHKVVIADWTDATEIAIFGSFGGGNGQFNVPCDVEVYEPSSRVYVSDTNNDRIQVFDLNGAFQFAFGTPGSGPGQFAFDCSGASIEIHDNLVYVADSVNDRIQVFDLDGNYIRQWGSTGSASGQFSSPIHIEIVDDKVYVTDFFNDRVQVFETDGAFYGTLAVNDPLWVLVDAASDAMWVSNNQLSGAVSSYATYRCNGQDLTMVGSSFDDTLTATTGDDVVGGGAGKDTIVLDDGHDTACGGPQKDVIRGNAGQDTIFGQGGNDSLFGGTDADTMDGGPGNDYIGGFGGPDAIFGGDGNDTIFGGFGADTIEGGNGNDTISGLIGNDTITGKKGDDALNGDAGKDTLFGSQGNDTLNGGKANDDLDGGQGTDTCSGNAGNGDTATDCELVFGVP